MKMPEGQTVIDLTDAPRWLLTSAVRRMPAERSDWGAAMLAELAQLQHSSTRWWFALGCARVALFPSRQSGLLQPFMNTINKPVCGIVSVTLTPLAILLVWFGSALFAGNPPQGVSSAIVLLSSACILSGVVFGAAGLVRRERLRWLSVIGLIVTLCIIGGTVIYAVYFDLDG